MRMRMRMINENAAMVPQAFSYVKLFKQNFLTVEGSISRCIRPFGRRNPCGACLCRSGGRRCSCPLGRRSPWRRSSGLSRFWRWGFSCPAWNVAEDSLEFPIRSARLVYHPSVTFECFLATFRKRECSAILKIKPTCLPDWQKADSCLECGFITRFRPPIKNIKIGSCRMVEFAP